MGSEHALQEPRAAVSRHEPRLTKVSPNCASLEPMRMSHNVGEVEDGADGEPFTAAITATSAARIARGMRWMPLR